MRSKALTVLFFISLTLVASVGHAQTDPGTPDTVRVDSLVTFGTGQRVLPIHLKNDENLAAVEVTIREASPAIVIDSISFAGTRLSGIGFKGWSHDTASGTTTFYAIATVDLITPGTGIMANAYLRVLDPAPRSVPIDTGSFQEGPLLRTTSFTADGSANSFLPRFRKGWVTITSAPKSMDSVTVDSVLAQRGGTANLPVFVSNETSLKQIHVALVYQSSELIFDSASFAGSRVVSATNTVSHNSSTHTMLISATLPDGAPLTPGNGLLCRLFFSVPVTATPGPVIIDSTTYFGLFGTEFTGASSTVPFVPIFHRGKIVIDESTDVGDEATLPAAFQLNQNYPNPFNPTTQIGYTLPSVADVRLEIFDLLGREVGVLVDERQPAGSYQVTLDASAVGLSTLASGIYFYRLTAGDHSEARKMLFLK